MIDCLQEKESSIPTRRRRTIAGAIFAVLGLGSIIGASETILFRSEHPILPSNVLSSPAGPACQRRPLQFSPPRDPDSRKYRHFDDVLLIVFFSHARYDTNLDSYRDVYSEYFPNVRPFHRTPLTLTDDDLSSPPSDPIYRHSEPRRRWI